MMIATIVDSVILLIQFLFAIIQTWIGLFIPTTRKNVSNKNVLITGSAQGIGKEMAMRFHRLGANLALIDINEVQLNQFVNELHQVNKSNKVIGYRCDLSEEQSINNVCEKIFQDFDHVDILISKFASR